jgi:hypothetical protein
MSDSRIPDFWCLMPPRIIKKSTPNKWTALLGFRLEIQGAKPAKLELTGNLQDPALGREGILEISVSAIILPEGNPSLILLCRMYGHIDRREIILNLHLFSTVNTVL